MEPSAVEVIAFQSRMQLAGMRQSATSRSTSGPGPCGNPARIRPASGSSRVTQIWMPAKGVKVPGAAAPMSKFSTALAGPDGDGTGADEDTDWGAGDLPPGAAGAMEGGGLAPSRSMVQLKTATTA